MKKIELLHFTAANKMSVNWLESGLARINWIRAVDKICVEQLICCQKCRANDCRAIAFRAVHPHSLKKLVGRRIKSKKLLLTKQLYFQVSTTWLERKLGFARFADFTTRRPGKQLRPPSGSGATATAGTISTAPGSRPSTTPSPAPTLASSVSPQVNDFKGRLLWGHQ